MEDPNSFDYVLVGGGLQNALIALGVLASRRGSVAIIEQDQALGGNHTWCFHADDLPRGSDYIEPLIVYRWPGYAVTFPGLTRNIETPYAGTTSERLGHVLSAAIARHPKSKIFLGSTARLLRENSVTLYDGTTLTGKLVVDARGPASTAASAGFQKFIGLEVELATPHAMTSPCLMDATVPQTDGFRFVYTLPTSPTRLIVEDTYFADTPGLDGPTIRAELRTYLDRHGHKVKAIVREEDGVLPLPWHGALPAITPSLPLRAGYAGGFFHPATGYSFPIAAKLAHYIASTDRNALFGASYQNMVTDLRKQMQYCYRLNRMLFHWFDPHMRFHVFERFYKLPEPLIRRFYSLNMSGADRARIMLGRPPRGFSVRARLSRGRG